MVSGTIDHRNDARRGQERERVGNMQMQMLDSDVLAAPQSGSGPINNKLDSTGVLSKSINLSRTL